MESKFVYDIFLTYLPDFAAKKNVMQYFYDKYQCWNGESMDPQYGTELGLIVNALPESTHIHLGIID